MLTLMNVLTSHAKIHPKQQPKKANTNPYTVKHRTVARRRRAPKPLQYMCSKQIRMCIYIYIHVYIADIMFTSAISGASSVVCC